MPSKADIPAHTKEDKFPRRVLASEKKILQEVGTCTHIIKAKIKSAFTREADMSPQIMTPFEMSSAPNNMETSVTLGERYPHYWTLRTLFTGSLLIDWSETSTSEFLVQS